jgi:ABC-type dipeptide/oligopeptide/nickel transport system ATPase subunit
MPAIHNNDLPTLEDKLEWKGEIERLSQRIQDCHTPHVMGVHGDWGSGKTSFMRQLQNQLGGEIPNDGSVAHCEKCKPPKERSQLQKQIISIWFDAWRYQNEPVPVVALLHEMRKQMAGLPAVKDKFKKLGAISLRYTLNSLADVGKAIGFEGLPSAEKIEKLGENWEKEHLSQILPTDSIRDHLHATIKSLLPNKNARVVVFIDDLDRCNPKAAFRLLEGLKIYLSIPDCVFVLGMNERILVDAIREEISAPKETSAEELKLRAAHYLEKICTDIYRLPLPKDTAVLFSGWIEGGEHKVALLEAINQTVCLPPNPRRLKALANQWLRFSMRVALPPAEKDRPVWAVRALIAAYIHQFHRDIWERWHFNPDFWVEFMKWCNDELGVNADGVPIEPPQWAVALNLTAHKTQESSQSWKSGFPNPGDINIFWLDGLIREHRNNLLPNDFKPLLQSGLQNTQTAP